MTEYLVRDLPHTEGANSFRDFLPVAKESKVAMFNWGLVTGKSQTNYPCVSWREQTTAEPEL